MSNSMNSSLALIKNLTVQLFKVKLKNYQNENLDGLINADIVISKYDLSFVLDKLKQPVGLALVAELADISLK